MRIFYGLPELMSRLRHFSNEKLVYSKKSALDVWLANFQIWLKIRQIPDLFLNCDAYKITRTH
jgi:hypothetical protein